MTEFDPSLARTERTTRPHAVVIGAGLGGLASAMRLGALGYRVTVLDRLDVPGGRGSALWRDGHRFDLGPTIVTVPQVFKELWAATGRRFHDDIDLRALDPFYEIRWPDGSRYAAREDPDAMRNEVSRLSPGDLPGYEKFLKDAEARYWFGFEDLGRRSMHRLRDLFAVLPTFARMRADRSVHAHVARRVKDPRLRMALSFHPLFIGGDPFNVTSMYTLVSHLESAFGVHYAMGGVAEIARVMARIVGEQGGLVRLGAEVDEIVVRGERATGVRLAGGEVIDADIVVSNADAGHTYQHLLRRTHRWRWTDDKLERCRWSMGLFVWYFGTRGTREMWPDVGHHTILNGPRYEGLVRDIFDRGALPEDMSLYVHRPSVTDPSVAPEGDDTFYVLSPVPHLGHADSVDWEVEREGYRRRVQETVERQLLPGLGEHLGAQEILTPADFGTRYLSPFGTGFSIEPRILQSAWFRPHNVSEEIEGLFLVGAGTHPGAGLPGVISSAEVLAQLVPDPAEVRA
ncbi:phytoene dehydrogenase [Roseivivax marinus]|uniref:Phytoene desaturase (neurosporene-forming) n=1 Tax=Roseivivax marinus TaxID=1379903 RepID=W4HK18_9RHOB|nr:phytoene desaturase [Roseivivax marinus]ETW12763.1 phytoene dehydrogenase [Roseivivax marinus]